jgi:uncharacterized protein (DUF433 family)
MPRNPRAKNPAGNMASGRSPGADISGSNGTEAETPRVVRRDGVAYVKGCDVPIWQLEMARRAGSPPDAMVKVFAGLTAEGLDLAFAYAQDRREEVDSLIRELGPTDVPPEEEDDDEAEFQADLDELFEGDAELFRRLAQ